MSNVKGAPKLPKQILPKGGVDHEGVCFRCGKPVVIEKASVLEEDGRIAEWHDFGMPEDVSMGPVLFGSDCASAMRKRSRHDLENDPSNDEPKEVYLERMKVQLEARSAEMRLNLEKYGGDHFNSILASYAFMQKVVDYQLIKKQPGRSQNAPA